MSSANLLACWPLARTPLDPTAGMPPEPRGQGSLIRPMGSFR